jgi:hypothetical protein
MDVLRRLRSELFVIAALVWLFGGLIALTLRADRFDDPRNKYSKVITNVVAVCLDRGFDDCLVLGQPKNIEIQELVMEFQREEKIIRITPTN